MTLPGWERLRCKFCEFDQFVHSVHIRYHPTGGTSEETGGYQCGACGKPADMAVMVREAKLRQRRAEVKAMEEEIQGAQPPFSGPPKT